MCVWTQTSNPSTVTLWQLSSMWLCGHSQPHWDGGEENWRQKREKSDAEQQQPPQPSSLSFTTEHTRSVVWDIPSVVRVSCPCYPHIPISSLVRQQRSPWLCYSATATYRMRIDVDNTPKPETQHRDSSYKENSAIPAEAGQLSR